jgi:hypothetical protein
MNPLLIARGIGKHLNLGLCDGDPVADGDFLPNRGQHFGVGAKGFHAPNVEAPALRHV